MIRAPSLIASDTSRRSRSRRCAAPHRRRPTSYRPSTTYAAKPGRSPSELMCTILARSLSLSTGNGSTTWRQEAGDGSNRLRSGPVEAGQRGDQLFPDGVQRRVGDLGEHLGEVVEDEPRPVGQHGDRGVGAHRPDRLGAGAGHRAEEDPQFFFGVAEHPLPRHQVGRPGQRAARGAAGRPGGPGRRAASSSYGCSLGQRRLDLLVLDDPAGAGVGQEDPARLQPALADHGRPGRCPARRPRWPERPGRRG